MRLLRPREREPEKDGAMKVMAGLGEDLKLGSLYERDVQKAGAGVRFAAGF